MKIGIHDADRGDEMDYIISMMDKSGKLRSCEIISDKEAEGLLYGENLQDLEDRIKNRDIKILERKIWGAGLCNKLDLVEYYRSEIEEVREFSLFIAGIDKIKQAIQDIRAGS